MADWTLRILDTPEEMASVEELQRQVWPGNETEVVPAHMLLAAAHNGGLVIGAYPIQPGVDPTSQANLPLIGFVFGFPGFYITPDGPRPKHCSHMMGVHPDLRDTGIGFSLKRAQWQMVRHQGLDLITWTYDPLLSRNAYLNISRLGAVCNTYRRNEYGGLRDSLNANLPTDRFQVDWWVNTQRVHRRLSKRPRLQLDLAHFLAAEAEIINPSQAKPGGWPHPSQRPILPAREALSTSETISAVASQEEKQEALLLVEIPSDFLGLKAAEPELALEWRFHTRNLFEELFEEGYLVTDFIHLPGSSPRSFYVLSHGESTL